MTLPTKAEAQHAIEILRERVTTCSRTLNAAYQVLEAYARGDLIERKSDEPQQYRERVLIEYNQFTLWPYRSWPRQDIGQPEILLWAGRGGAAFLSGGNDHYADVLVQVWDHEPPYDKAREDWDLIEQGVLETNDATMVLVGATGRISDSRIELPSAGRFGIRAHCRGREAASKVDVADGRGFRSGLESWLIQIWPDAAPAT